MQQLAKQQNGFDSVVSGIIGPHIKKGKGSDWFRDKEPVDPDAVYVAFITSMMVGGINWGEDRKVESISAVDVATAGILKNPPEGYRNYSTSMMLLDQEGLICTFTSSSYGGKSAFEALIFQYKMHAQASFPLVKLSSRPRGDFYDTIDPVFQIVGWKPASEFVAITGDEPKPAQIAPPSPPSETKSETAKPKKRPSTGELINDEIPF